MNKHIPLLFFLLLTFNTVRAQIDTGGPVSALHDGLRVAVSDTARANRMIELGMHHITRYYSKDNVRAVDSAQYYLDRSMALTQKINYQRGIGHCYSLESRIFKAKANFEAAEAAARKGVEILSECGNRNDLVTAYNYLAVSAHEVRPPAETAAIYEKIYKLYMELGDTEAAAGVLLNIGYTHMVSGQLEKGMEELRDALQLYDGIGHKEVQRIYSLLAIGNNELGNYDKAIEYGLKGVRLVEELNDNGLLAAELYRYMGVIYTNINAYEKAYEYCIKGHNIAKNYNYHDMTTMLEANIITLLVEMDRSKEALQYLNLLQKKYNSLLPGIRETVVLTSIQIYTDLKDYTNASKYIADANTLLSGLDGKDMRRLRFYEVLADYYYDSGQYGPARSIAKEREKVSRRLKDMEHLKRTHQMLYKLDSINTDYVSSLHHLKKYQAYKDSLMNVENTRTIARLQLEYDTEKKDRELLLKEQNNKILKQQAELQKSELSKTTIIKNVSLIGIVLLAVVLALIFRRYRINQRIRREIHLNNTTLKNLLNEKEWLLKEIHHRVKNNLQIVMSLLNTQSHYLNDDTAKAAIKNSQHRIHSMSLIHKKLYQSANVVSVNMDVYIKELVEYFKVSFDTGQQIRFNLDIDPVEIDTSKAVPLGLILNETIVNSIKHAFSHNRKGSIAITFKYQSDNKIRLTIKDDGTGIDGNIAEKAFNSLGIKLIKGFSGELDAQLEFVNENGFGITLEFHYDRRNHIDNVLVAIETSD